jgi:hypothetical protein
MRNAERINNVQAEIEKTIQEMQELEKKLKDVVETNKRNENRRDYFCFFYSVFNLYLMIICIGNILPPFLIYMKNK